MENLNQDFIEDDFEASHTSQNLTITIYQNQTNTTPIEEINSHWWGLRHLFTDREIRHKKDGKAFSAVKLKPGKTRESSSVDLIYCMVADIDGKDKQAPELEAILNRFSEYEILAYSTHSYNPEIGNISYRIIFPLRRPITPEEYKKAWVGFNFLIGGYCDVSTRDPSRIFFLPSCPEATSKYAWWFDNHGECLDPDYLMLFSPKLEVPKLKIIGGTEHYPETDKNIAEVDAMLKLISANCSREHWLKIIWALASTGWLCSKELARDWSMTCPERFNENDFDRDWDSYNPDRDGGITLGTLRHYAKLSGWLEQPNQSDPLAFLQSKYALIKVNGIWFIDKHIKGAVDGRGQAKALEMVNKTDGNLLLRRSLKEAFPELGEKESKLITVKFPIDLGTTMYFDIEFNPKPTSSGALNLWVDYTVQPKSGNWNLIYEFLFDIICAGSDREFQYLIRYFAHALQKPEEKPGVMIVMLGGQGIGKGTLAKIARIIWRKTYLQVSRVEEITGTFNAQLERSYIVFIDEAFFKNDQKATSCLKSLVTEQTVLINQKNQPARQVDSYHRFISATNAEHFKSTDRDDRRDFVLRISEAKKGDHDYWRALNNEIEHGGVEAFVDYLLKLDITDFNVRVKPHTKELTEQKLHSLGKFEQWWHQCLLRGHFSDLEEQQSWPEFKSTVDLRFQYKEEMLGGRTADMPLNTEIKKLLSKLCHSATSEQKNEGHSRKRGYVLPTLDVARKEFESFIGDTIVWED